VGGIDKFLDVSINEDSQTLKTEPVDYDENAVGYEDYFEEDDDPADEDYTGLDSNTKNNICKCMAVASLC
jgi:hypothetical protein